MSGSVTVNLPSARRVLRIIAGLIAFGALLLIGVAIGSRLLTPDGIGGLATPGTIQQVRVQSGAVYVGRIVSSDGEYLQIADPATIRQGDVAASASSAPRLVVEALGIEPYDTVGDLVIPIHGVELVATVRPGSDLDIAYQQAIASASAAPGSSPAP